MTLVAAVLTQPEHIERLCQNERESHIPMQLVAADSMVALSAVLTKVEIIHMSFVDVGVAASNFLIGIS